MYNQQDNIATATLKADSIKMTQVKWSYKITSENVMDIYLDNGRCYIRVESLAGNLILHNA